MDNGDQQRGGNPTTIGSRLYPQPASGGGAGNRPRVDGGLAQSRRGDDLAQPSADNVARRQRAGFPRPKTTDRVQTGHRLHQHGGRVVLLPVRIGRRARKRLADAPGQRLAKDPRSVRQSAEERPDLVRVFHEIAVVAYDGLAERAAPGTAVRAAEPTVAPAVDRAAGDFDLRTRGAALIGDARRDAAAGRHHTRHRRRRAAVALRNDLQRLRLHRERDERVFGSVNVEHRDLVARKRSKLPREGKAYTDRAFAAFVTMSVPLTLESRTILATRARP
jgi:hypothetical protein